MINTKTKVSTHFKLSVDRVLLLRDTAAVNDVWANDVLTNDVSIDKKWIDDSSRNNDRFRPYNKSCC